MKKIKIENNDVLIAFIDLTLPGGGKAYINVEDISALSEWKEDSDFRAASLIHLRSGFKYYVKESTDEVIQKMCLVVEV